MLTRRALPIGRIADLGATRPVHHGLLAILSGALLALSFPQFGHPLFAWVALVPLLVALRPVELWPKAFGLGLTTGVVHFAGTLYWLGAVMTDYGGLSTPAAWAVQALLIAYLALFPAAFAVTLVVAGRAVGPAATMLAPAVWVSTELGRMYVLGGFPWELIGYSQTFVTPVAQLASVFGVHGVSALVVLVNAALAIAVLDRGRLRSAALSAGALALGLTVLVGASRVQRASWLAEGTPLRVGLLQGNVAQNQKWDAAFGATILDRYLRLAREAAADGAEFIVWPESATPFRFEEDAFGQAAIRRVSEETGAFQLVGSTRIIGDEAPLQIYNAAFMLDDRGETAGLYHKVYLVPFGEYVPLRRLLFFVSPLVETVADFTPGAAAGTLPVFGRPISTAICYEIIYPGLIGRFVDAGSQLLTTITNDAWYGESSAPYQHFQQAAMRAIEQGRYVVRAANTGISGVIDPYGRVIASTPIFETRVVAADVRLIERRTVYGRLGDVFAYACLAMTAGALLAVAGAARLLKN